jgi:hypothetical protein
MRPCVEPQWSERVKVQLSGSPDVMLQLQTNLPSGDGG